MPIAAQQTIIASAKGIQDWIVARRRHLHRNPELSFHEERTAAFVEKELRSLGFTTLHTRLNGNFGICAELPGRDRSRCVALRGDMDALPIQEASEWEFQSQVPGVSHMCGHDAHTSMLLGAARILKEREAELPCTVRFFFQGGEEKFPGGARDFIIARMLEDVEFLFGLHVDPRFDVGVFRLSPGPRMAGVDEFTIRVKGVGGHAAYPQATRDPILCAAHIVTALQQIVSRETDPFEPAVVSVTRFNGGTAFNVIPAEVELNGTVRSFRRDMHAHFSTRIARIAGHVAESFGCTAELEMPEGYPPLDNDPRATEILAGAAREIVPSGVMDLDPIMGSEDFALYTPHVAAAFGFLGVAASADQDRYFVHHPKFFMDEDALWRGSAILATAAWNAAGET